MPYIPCGKETNQAHDITVKWWVANEEMPERHTTPIYI
jgi:hypothetical protein